MRAPPFLAAVALATSLLAAAPAREPSAVPESFPGLVQPDPGTGFSCDRRGTAAAFAASWREAGDRHDPAATPTVFLWDLRAGSLRQLTASGPSDQPSVENGVFYARIGSATEKTRTSRTVVAFRSTANLAGRNADGSAEIFVWDSQTNAFTQVSDAISGASSDPVLGARFHAVRDAEGLYTGQLLVRWRVAFLSTSDLAGDNPGGLSQVFHYDSGAPEVGRLVQVSHATAGPAQPPVINGGGDRVAFVQDEDIGGPFPLQPIYLWDRQRGVRQVYSPFPLLQTRELAMDSTGRWLAWTRDTIDRSTGNLAGETISRLDLRTRRTHGADFPPGSSRRASLASGGTPLVCLSTDSGDIDAPAAERPVELRMNGTVREIGLPGGKYGAVRLAKEARFLLLTTTENLDGTNAAGREVLFTVRYRP